MVKLVKLGIWIDKKIHGENEYTFYTHQCFQEILTKTGKFANCQTVPWVTVLWSGNWIACLDWAPIRSLYAPISVSDLWMADQADGKCSTPMLRRKHLQLPVNMDWQIPHKIPLRKRFFLHRTGSKLKNNLRYCRPALSSWQAGVPDFQLNPNKRCLSLREW